MGNAARPSGKKQQDEWVPTIGETIYTAGSSKNDAAWDDSELIEHWDTALEQYKRHYSDYREEHAEKHPFEPSPAEASSATNGKPSKRQRVTNTSARTKAPAPATFMPPPPVPPMPSMPPPPPPPPHPASSSASPAFPPYQPAYPIPSQDQDMANVIMAWYYCGYYMGYYQGSQQQQRRM